MVHMLLAEGWEDYELIDSGGGEKLERWGSVVLRRPDPHAIWPKDGAGGAWERADAAYHRSDSGGGHWEPLNGHVPSRWPVRYGKMRLGVQLMQFKHTGVFPEQASNWRWIEEKLANAPGARVLNLFAYTGAATVASALAGAVVCHVDSARGITQKAKENAELSGVPAGRTRYIVDDVQKFVAREARRGNEYDAVIMDPPAYGRGPGGELWQAEAGLYGLVSQCCGLLSGTPVFFLVSSYAPGITPTAAENVLALSAAARFGGSTSSFELGLRERARGLALPCGCCARWEP